MHLSREQDEMLGGEYGQPVSEAMGILTAVGEINDAQRLIPVASAHIAGLSYKSHGDAGIEYAENLVKERAQVRVYTTLNTCGIDTERWRAIGLPEEFAAKQTRINRCYEAMGCVPLYSCTPYYSGSLPRFGEPLAWSESSAVIFANSVLGARTNREGGPSALASALTGFTPEYGLLMDENRLPSVIVDVRAQIKDLHDYGALGSHIGSVVGDGVPLVTGLPRDASVEDLASMGAGMASAGSVALFHAEGITPEISEGHLEPVGRRRLETFVFEESSLSQAKEKLSSGGNSDVEYVAIGCPHASVRQLETVARALKDKKVHDGTRLWVHTSAAARTIAERRGYVQHIHAAGGIVTCDMCTTLGPPENLGIRSVATNSAKLAFYAPGSNRMDVCYGDLHKCIEASTRGRWDE